jgi:flagellar basal-body rod protein FlgG
MTAGNLVVANFINPDGLVATGGNLFLETSASGTPVINMPGTNGTGSVMQNTLEQSNVNVAEQLVNMIAAQRLYEIQARAITASDQMLQKIGQL